ncbi:MAG TPA: LCP family protein [Solirubrobacteraceae bacterium]|nr:LCP family protein [Solirubrobacteraceae bacterium]
MWKRFALAAVLIAALSGTATATVALNNVSEWAGYVFQGQIKGAPKGLITSEYEGGPKTFLVLGTDRRAHSTDALDRENPPHSDTILLVRFDPGHGQTTLLSIPRDLLVTIRTKEGQVYANQKINAAYTLGSRLGGSSEGSLLAAETIKREVFPSLKLSGIVDVNFAGFIRLVDKLGCAYVNVDHRYYNLNVGSPETDYTSINLQPGYQKLCYENALDYVRYRHTDSDFVRVARQQDFLRDLREQVDPGNLFGELNTVAKAVGHAIKTTITASASHLIELSKLIAFSQAKPLRQVRFQSSNVNAVINGGSYVTSTPALEQATLEEFLGNGNEQDAAAAASPSSHAAHPSSGHAHHHSHLITARSAGMVATSGESEVVKAALRLPFRVLYPAYQTMPAHQETTRAYSLRDEHGHLHKAYVVVWQQTGIGGYYDFEGTNWLNPPLFAHARERTLRGRKYLLVYDGSHIHVIGWHEGRVLYWVSNTLLEDLSNDQMWVVAKSAQSLH